MKMCFRVFSFINKNSLKIVDSYELITINLNVVDASSFFNYNSACG